MKRVVKPLAEGDKVIILEGDLQGEWGVLKFIDGDDYYVSPWNGQEQLLFSKDELRRM